MIPAQSTEHLTSVTDYVHRWISDPWLHSDDIRAKKMRKGLTDGRTGFPCIYKGSVSNESAAGVRHAGESQSTLGEDKSDDQLRHTLQVS